MSYRVSPYLRICFMLTLESFRDKKILVMGLGLHGGGVGAAIWLMRHGARVTVTDLREEKVLEPQDQQADGVEREQEKAGAVESARRGGRGRCRFVGLRRRGNGRGKFHRRRL